LLTYFREGCVDKSAICGGPFDIDFRNCAVDRRLAGAADFRRLQRTPATSPNSAASPTTTSSDAGPATFITLSDQAKAAAAARAQSDQTAADNLQAYVEAHRVNSTGTTGTPTSASTEPASSQPTTGSKVEAIVAQIKALADANEPQPFQPFTPTKSLSNSATVDGYTLTLDTNAGTQFYGMELSGNGAQIYDKHFGPSDQAIGGGGEPPGCRDQRQHSQQ
jgi:hypothetical protein